MEDVKERLNKEVEILARYLDLQNVDLTDKLLFLMDIEYSKVDLDKLIAQDDNDFEADVNGILCNMDRVNKKLVGFMPKAGLKERT